MTYLTVVHHQVCSVVLVVEVVKKGNYACAILQLC
jgi:hypothetical protein